MICATPEAVSQAIAVLSVAPYLLLDLEGHELGCEGGAPSVISVGTPGAAQIYLFDTIALSPQALGPLFGILGSGTRTKFLWDGRQDFAELYFSYNLTLAGVLDLQIADIVSRSVRGEDETRRINRLTAQYYYPNLVRRLQIDGVHGVTSLKTVLLEHLAKEEHPDPAMKTFSREPQPKVSHEDWMQRPLSPLYEEYAARDIQTIAHVVTFFESKGYLRDTHTLLAQSKRHITVHRDLGRPRTDNSYLQSNILPLEVLDGPSDKERRFACDKCGRKLTDVSFPHKNSRRMPSCKVCTLITDRMFRQRLKAERVAARAQAKAAKGT